MIAAQSLFSRVLHLRDHEFLRYVIASGAALTVDMGSFLGLLALQVPAVMAAALAYSLGMVTHWMLLSRSVFESRVAGRRGRARTQQKALFVVTTFGGLALTTTIVSTGEWTGLNVQAAKVLAVGLSFLLNYEVRRRFVFKSKTLPCRRLRRESAE